VTGKALLPGWSRKVTLVGAAAAVNVVAGMLPALLPVKGASEPVIVAVTPVLSPALLLGCHVLVTTPPELVVPEDGVNDVVAPADGYAPLETEKETGIPC